MKLSQIPSFSEWRNSMQIGELGFDGSGSDFDADCSFIELNKEEEEECKVVK